MEGAQYSQTMSKTCPSSLHVVDRDGQPQNLTKNLGGSFALLVVITWNLRAYKARNAFQSVLRLN